MNLNLLIKYLFSPTGGTLFIMSNLLFLLLSIPQSALSQARMTNEDFILRFGNLNTSSGNISGSGFKLGFTAGQTSQGLYSGENYKVKAGFQYAHPIGFFRFSISSQLIDFGPLAPGTPITRTNNLTINSGAAKGYKIIASENHPLRDGGTNDEIPDSSCDDGSCTEIIASEWSNVLTYGFGYRCDNVNGNDCTSGFSNENNFKQFANIEISEIPQPVMLDINRGKDQESQITYKTNISANQPAGLYENIITYIAIPSI